MTLVSNTLPKLRRAREKAGALGLRPVTVTVRTRVYSGPVGAVGTVLSSTTNVVITPTPRVAVDHANRSDEMILDGSFADATADPLVVRWVVGPITPTHTGGGYAASDFMPGDNVARRVTIVLSGGQFGGGEEFRVVRCDDTKALRIMLTIERTRQGA